MNCIPAILTKVNSARKPGKEGTVMRVRASCCRALVRWEDGKETEEPFEELEYATKN